MPLFGPQHALLGMAATGWGKSFSKHGGVSILTNTCPEVQKGSPALQAMGDNGFNYFYHGQKSRNSKENGYTSPAPMMILTASLLLTINASVPDHAPFFAYMDSSVPDGYSPLTRSDLMEQCNDIWVSAGLTALSGHSFRIGGTTHLLIHGVDPWIVMKQGCWSSNAFLLYWRNVEEILPLFIGDSMDSFSLKSSIQQIQKL